MKWIIAFLLLFSFSVPAQAVNPDEILADPVLETRARAISAELRCLVCQNQSIDDSDAQLARDLRLLVRERLVLGDSDTEVVEYIVARYGEYVLLKPYFGWHTLALWAIAPLMLLLSTIAAILAVRTRNARLERLSAKSARLTREEKAALDTLR